MNRSLLLLLTCSTALALTSCAQINSLIPGQKSGTTPQPGSGQQSTGTGQQNPAPSQGPMSGNWILAVSLNDQLIRAHMRLNQKGNDFSGQGTDDETGRKFTIEEGKLAGEQISFYKNYAPDADGTVFPPMSFTGKFDMVDVPEYKGPHIMGGFNMVVDGQPMNGEFEGQSDVQPAPQEQPVQAPPAQGSGSDFGNYQPNSAPANQQTSGSSTSGNSGGDSAPAPSNDASGHPHLSGKWNVSYDYDFKTMRAKMFLEEDEGKIRGHGTDLNTNERFDIEKGWYAYPKVTLIFKYTKGKGAAHDRSLTCKSKVTTERGLPVLKGQTQGGGDWKATLLR